MRTLWQDIRYGFRMLARNPGFTTAVVLILALGIGASSAIFGVINAVILRPLPFDDGSRLVMIWEMNKKTGEGFHATTPERFQEWRKLGTAFEAMSAMRETGATFAEVENATHVSGVRVTADFFSILRVKPHLGRVFIPDDELANGQPIVILSHGLWQRLYGGDPEVIGKTVALADMFGENAKPYTVVGIMPPGFRFPYSYFPYSYSYMGNYAQFWLPLLRPEFAKLSRELFVLGRLKPGVTVARAEAQMDTIAGRLAQEHPDPHRPNMGVHITSLHNRMVRNVRSSLLVLWGAVTFLLLIACSNVANLLLARSATRLREIAVRLSVGASRWRIVRQLLTESVLLGGLGGLLGLLLAFWGVKSLVALSGSLLPRVEEINIDARVMVFAFVLSTVTGLIFGLVPAVRASKTDLNKCLKEGAIPLGWTSSRPASIRGVLAITEIAVSLVLLIGAGVLVRSYILVSNVELGFNPQNIVTVQMNSIKAPSRALLERISALPAVRSVGATSVLPIVGNWRYEDATVEGELPKNPGQERPVYAQFCTPGYFRTMEIPVLRGRGITEQDTSTSLPVAVVNETLVKQFVGGVDPIGRQIKWDGNNTWYTIVGVMRDVRHLGLDKKVFAEVYFPWEQQPFIWGWVDLVIRGASDDQPLAASIVAAIRALDRQAPIQSVRTMEEIIQQSFVARKFQTVLLGLFAAMGLILASVGIYGVVNYSVNRRTHEIGIRMALGARTSDVLIMVVQQGLKLTLIGVAIGVVAALALTRVISSLLYGVSPTDPMTFVCVLLFLTGVALLASYIPARRATKVDPMVTLRYE